MSIEHKLLQAGEQHVVANWLVATVPELDNISVTFADIGKQAWVQGVGHYTLANSDPITWEAASPTLASFTYTTGTKLLELGLSTGETLRVTLDGQTAAQVAALIAAHAAASDPHGDRAFATAADSTLLGTVNTSLSLKADKATTIAGTAGRITGGGSLATDRIFDLASIGAGATAGGADSSLTLTYDAYGRVTGCTVSAIAVAQSQVTGLVAALAGKEATLPNVVTAGTYGSATQVPVITLGAKGIVTAVSLATITVTPTFADNLFRVQDNADATKQLALEVSAVSSGTTKTWTVPNCDLHFGKLRHTMVVPSGQTVGAGAYTWPALLAQGGKLDIRMSTGDITTDIDSLLNGGHVVEYTNESAATRTLSLFGFGSVTYDETGTPLSYLQLRTGATAKIVWPTAGGTYARTHGRFYSDEFRLGDATTPTKGLTFALSGITAGATRVVTAADANVNMTRLIGYTTAPSNVTVTASPFSRINPSSVLDEDLIVAGGTVSLIEFSRNGSTFYDVGVVAGMFRLSPADRLRITYTVAPTVTSIPR